MTAPDPPPAADPPPPAQEGATVTVADARAAPTVLEPPPGLDEAGRRTLDAWAATLLANPGATPGLTLRPPSSAAGLAATGAGGRGDGGAAGATSSLAPRTAIAFPGAPPPEAAAPCDYVVTRELGRGGMGVVYEAEQATIGRRVAIKMLQAAPGAGDPRAEARFVGEARATGRLEHPNIVPVYDLGRTRDARLYLGMRLVKGESLTEVLRREADGGPAALRRHLEVVCAVCDAVAYAHARGVLHRDLKPDNVMVGEFGEVQVMDWGLAVDVGPDGRAAGVDAGTAGTVAYMSPEQAGGDPTALGTWSDVYLLGAVLYQVLTGRPPHRGTSVVNVLLRACEGRVDAPAAAAPGRWIPRDLEQLCLSALDPDPARRPASARALKEGIRRHLAHAEALQLVERARAAMEGVDPAQADAGEDLGRAGALLAQALAVWPESEEARALARQVRALSIERALDRGEGRRAKALADGLDAGPGVPAERVEELRGAATRQVRAWRNQVAAAGLILVGALAGRAALDRRGAAAEAAAGPAAARAQLGRLTGEAWTAVHAGGLDEVRAALDRVREVARAAGWADACDDPTASTAAAWLALRQGEPGRAADLLPAPWRGRLGAALLEPDLLAAADGWARARREAGDPPALAAVGEAALLVAAARASPDAAPAVRARLAASGALAALTDAGLPAGVLEGLPARTTLRPGAARPPRREGAATGGPREADRVVVGLDLDRRERWRWPPPVLGYPSATPLPPLLLRDGDAWRVVTAWGPDLVSLDPATGVVVGRVRLRARIDALLPAGPDRLLAVIPAVAGHGRSRLVPCSAGGALEPLTPGTDLLTLGAAGNLALSQLGTEDARDRAAAEAQLARLPAARARDPGSAQWDALAAPRLQLAGRTDEARAAAARAAAADLSSFELARLADRLDEVGLPGEAERTLEAAAGAHRRAGHNPDLQPLVMGNPALFARKVAARAAQRGDEARLLRLMALGREVATAIEGDAVALPIERRWLEAHGRTDAVAALAPFEPRARRLGGVYLTPHELVEGFDPCLALVLVMPVVLGLGGLGLWLRVREQRVADLRALGFRSAWSRLLAFATNPLLRLSCTTLAYATRTERLALVAGALLAVCAVAYLDVIVRKVGELSALPFEVGAGVMGHPSAEEVVLARLEADPEAGPAQRAAGLRLLVEGALQRGEEPLARARLEALLALAPDDPFARNNVAVLDERAGQPERARAGYGQAAAAPGELGAVGRWNLARLDGRPAAPLPPPYAALRRVEGAERAPLVQLAAADDLSRALAALASPWRAVAARLAEGPGQLGLFDVFQWTGDGGLPDLRLLALAEWLVRYPIPALLLLALLYVPFGTRRVAPRPGPQPRALRWFERATALLDLLLPGARALGRRRPLEGAQAVLVALLLAYVAMGRQGPVVAAIAMPEATSPFGEVGPRDLLTSRQVQLLAVVASAGLLLLYAAAWLGAAWRLRAGRASAGGAPAPGG